MLKNKQNMEKSYKKKRNDAFMPIVAITLFILSASIVLPVIYYRNRPSSVSIEGMTLVPTPEPYDIAEYLLDAFNDLEPGDDELDKLRESIVYGNFSDEYVFELVEMEREIDRILQVSVNGDKIYVGDRLSSMIYIFDKDFNLIGDIDGLLWKWSFGGFRLGRFTIFNDELFVASQPISRTNTETEENDFEFSQLIRTGDTIIQVFDLNGTEKHGTYAGGMLYDVSIIRYNVDKFDNFLGYALGEYKYLPFMPESIKIIGSSIYMSMYYTANERARIYKIDPFTRTVECTYGINMMGPLCESHDKEAFAFVADGYFKSPEDSEDLPYKKTDGKKGFYLIKNNEIISKTWLFPGVYAKNKTPYGNYWPSVNYTDIKYRDGFYYVLASSVKGASSVLVFDTDLNYVKTYLIDIGVLGKDESDLDYFCTFDIAEDGTIYIGGDGLNGGLIVGRKK